MANDSELWALARSLLAEREAEQSSLYDRIQGMADNRDAEQRGLYDRIMSMNNPQPEPSGIRDSILATLSGMSDRSRIPLEDTPGGAIADSLSAAARGAGLLPDTYQQTGPLEKLALKASGVNYSEVKPTPSLAELQRAVLEEARANAEEANERLVRLREISGKPPYAPTLTFSGVGNKIVGDFKRGDSIDDVEPRFSKSGRGLRSKAGPTERDFRNSGMSEAEARLRVLAAETGDPKKAVSFLEAAEKVANREAALNPEKAASAMKIQAAKMMAEAKNKPQGEAAVKLLLSGMGLTKDQILEILDSME